MTGIRRQRGERRCRPPNEWPALDRQSWQAALTAGDVLEPGGCRAERSRFSNRGVQRGYGRWLTWLAGRQLLDQQIAPGERITPERVRAYAGDLEEQNASATVIARLVELKIMAAIMDPGRDWSWIYRVAAPIRTRHKAARPKQHRLVPVQKLLQLGLELMAAADNQPIPKLRFQTFRDGLIIALLAWSPAAPAKPCRSHPRSDPGPARRAVVDPDPRRRDQDQDRDRAAVARAADALVADLSGRASSGGRGAAQRRPRRGRRCVLAGRCWALR